jgi:hypothetical protein
MNLYYFHIRDRHTILDEVGSLLPNMAAVKTKALTVTSELIGSPRSAHWGRRRGACGSPKYQMAKARHY